MFTGIVESVGTVTSVEDGGATARLTIASPGLGGDLVHGESIAVNGVCLTVAHVDDDAWTASIEAWRHDVRRLTGNPVEVLEVSADEAATKLAGRAQVWVDIRRDGRVVYGLGVDELRAVRSA